MEKIALTKAAEVLRNTSAVLRQLSTKYDELETSPVTAAVRDSGSSR